MAAGEPIRVLLVDDHAVVREGYRRLLERTGQIVVCAEAESGEQAYRLFGEQPVDVVIMDITLPGIGGIETMRRMLGRDTRARVLIFSMHDDVVFSAQALQAGARGYITKSSAPEVLVEAVQAIARGEQYIGHDVAQKLVIQRVLAQDDRFAALTGREFEVFRLLALGHSVPEISRILSLNHKTVANYQTSIKQKLGVENTMQLLHVALERGLIAKKG
jgi:DNA-binding NarL/FixJ family response regulator